MLAGACLQTILQKMQVSSNVNLSTDAILAFTISLYGISTSYSLSK
jgi:hypothetical protein